LRMKIMRYIKKAQRILFIKLYQLRRVVACRKYRSPIISFIGYLNLPIGIGEAFRSFLRLALRSNFSNSVHVVDYTLRSGDKRKDASGAEFNHLINIKGKADITFISVNPDGILRDIGYFKRQTRGSYSICRLNWELPTFPDRWLPVFDIFNEIWVTSRYEYDTMSKSVIKPITIMPIPIDVKTDVPRDPSSRKIFKTLVMFDGDSYVERKNPQAALKAYVLALGDDPDSFLTVKINNYTKACEDKYNLSKYFNERTTIITATMSREEIDALIASTDVYISLHRAEGYGLILAEAMACGIPCIAPAWSGNMEFMTPSNSCLVSYNLVQIQENLGSHYDKGNYWADANVAEAAEYLKRLRFDNEYYSEKSRAALKSIDSTISSRVVLKKFNDRFQAICSSLGFINPANQPQSDVINK